MIIINVIIAWTKKTAPDTLLSEKMKPERKTTDLGGKFALVCVAAFYSFRFLL